MEQIQELKKSPISTFWSYQTK